MTDQKPTEPSLKPGSGSSRGKSLQEKFRRAFIHPRATEQSDTTKESTTNDMITDEKIETQQNTDPASDPADSTVGGATSEAAPDNVQAEASSGAAGIGSVPAADLLRMKTERDQLQDRIARLQAEFDNSRKREARERADFREYAVAGAVEQFLPVLDNFQLALKSDGSAEQLKTGVGLIVKQMEDALRQLNVQPVGTVGVPFDPRVHEALDSVEKPDLPDQQVFEEVRRGYKIKDRLLRPALVRVVSNPQQKEA